MKFKISLLAILLIMFHLSALGQEGQQVEKGIQFDQIEVKRSNGQVIKINDPSNRITKTLGNPVKTEPYLFEMLEKTGTLFTYGDSRIFELESKFETFTIRGDEFLVGYKGKFVKVGDNISKVLDMYPPANNYKDSKSFAIPLKLVDGSVYDAYLIITFDPFNSKVTQIIKYKA